VGVPGDGKPFGGGRPPAAPATLHAHRSGGSPLVAGRVVAVTAYTDIPRSEDFLGHPKGVFVCFFTEMWERFSFYGMKALLLLYFIKHHGFDDASGYDLNGVYGGLVYAVPVVGGLSPTVGSGMRKSVVLGGLLLCMGHLGMAYEGTRRTGSTGSWCAMKARCRCSTSRSR
jgi:POT family proton-dependent oligopeptide transporter